MAGVFQKLRNFLTEEEVVEVDDEKIAQEDAEQDTIYSDDFREEYQPSAVSEKKENISSSGSSKVVNIHATTQLQVVLAKPELFDDEIRSIADELIRRRTVVLNLEKTEKEASRRIIDFLSGVAYAHDGKIKRIATNTFIITPCNVDLLGEDILDELGNNGVYL